MNEEKTPGNPITNYFTLNKKRERPSTSSSQEGTVSKKPSVRREEEGMMDLQSNLMEEFDKCMTDSETDSAVNHIDKQMEKCFREFKDQIRDMLKNVLSKVNSRMNVLEDKVKELEGKAKNIGESNRRLQIDLNRQIQYSKKDNLRIFGLEEKTDENCREEISNLVKTKLKVKILPADISTAHRLPKTQKQKHKSMIVRFKDRTQRREILKVRKLLKGTGISIGEDITRDNMTLIQDAEKSGRFESVWFHNGKVLAKNIKDKKRVHTLDLFVDFDEITR